MDGEIRAVILCLEESLALCASKLINIFKEFRVYVITLQGQNVKSLLKTLYTTK